MDIKEKNIGADIILAVEGDIDFSITREFKKKYENTLSGPAKKIILNLNKVLYIDSAGLAALIEVMQRSKTAGKELLFAEPTEKVKNIFEVTKLKKLFRIYDTEAEALQA